MSEIEVAGQTYQIGKLNAMTQFHLTRRLGPMLVVAGVSLDMLRNGMKVDINDIVAMAGPVMGILSKMEDEDVDYIVFTCLSCVKRKQVGDTWAPMSTKDSKGAPLLMFEDVEMPEMIRIVLEVLRINLGNFLTGLFGDPSSKSDLVPGQPQAMKS